ncbi:hydroxylysine kinase isoform 3-T4 [Spinachia spinachia]
MMWILSFSSVVNLIWRAQVDVLRQLLRVFIRGAEGPPEKELSTPKTWTIMAALHSKPNFSNAQVVEMVARLFSLTPSEIRPFPSYDDQNFYVSCMEGGEYVLKIMNSEDSENPSMIEVQTFAMSVLHRNGLPAQTALPNAAGQLMSLEEMDCGHGVQKYMMVHPNLGLLDREKFVWSLSNVPQLEANLNILEGDPLEEIVKSVIHQYKTSVMPKRSNFRKCINHGDFNDLNVLVQLDESGGHRISGILDFGDMNNGYYIYELAIAIMYMMTEHPEPVEVGGPVLAGWESVLPLNETEKDCLYALVLSRFCQSMVIARHAVKKHPENEEYLMISSRRGVHILRQLWELGKEQVEKAWFQSATQFSDRL